FRSEFFRATEYRSIRQLHGNHSQSQLVVDLIDAANKRLVWRGMAQQNLSQKPGKLIDQVNTAIAKMFKQYPPRTAS
ncbi:MAG TPA: DUF4136 domain-containing protein, partial [Candidatus Binatia bacterium]|nr:DUF4136 domain-containing protein [Candidatus Binatia bacterium]